MAPAADCNDQVLPGAVRFSQRHDGLGVAKTSLSCKVDADTDLQVNQVVTAIKRAAELASQKPEQYGSHSLRSDGATALFNASYDILVVKLFGRWRSDAVKRYTRIGGCLMEKMAVQMLAKSALKRDEGVSSTHSLAVEALQFNLFSFVPFHGTPPNQVARMAENRVR
ncbi:hypothetical protein ON010_g6321 [Phytophthora cinnamomi]|nr:hypothetical protein ON010_g6321 [Phytophthora cinnamomi]